MLKYFAQDLRKNREEKNISLQEICNTTRIHISIFERMESGDFEFQPQTYIRAFLRHYARHTGLDENEVMYNFGLAKSGKYVPKTAPEAKEPKDSKPKETKEKEYVSKEIPIAQESKFPVEEIVHRKKSTVFKEFTPNEKYIPNDRGTPFIPEKKFIKVSPVFSKTLFGILGGVLLLAGIYFLINNILSPRSNKTDIVRQNFDEVVKENEKKILGKRTDEEIADSIKKAKDKEIALLKAGQDSIKLEIIALKAATITLRTDSARTPEIIYLEKKESVTHKAKHFFILSAGNTNLFEATINGKKVKFDEVTARKIKITKDGIVTK